MTDLKTDAGTNDHTENMGSTTGCSGNSTAANSSCARRELVLTAGDYEARINHVGASLRSLTYKGHPLTDTYPLADTTTVGDGGEATGDESGNIPFCAGIVLAPWPNRVRDGRFDFRGETHQLDLTEPERSNAIHGLVGFCPWEEAVSAAELETEASGIADDNADTGDVSRCAAAAGELCRHIAPTKGWPWAMTVTASFKLRKDSGLAVTYRLVNDSEETIPVAFGVHTYLNAWGTPIDECTAFVPVTDCLPLDSERNLPLEPLRLVPLAECTDTSNGTQDLPREETDWLSATARLPESLSFDSGQQMQGVWLDHAFVDARKATADRTIRLVHSSGKGVEMTASPTLPWFQIFTADPDHGQGFPGRGRALAVEPMSAPPDALRSGIGLVELPPGRSVAYTITFRALTGD